MRDTIIISGLELTAHIGVPDEERANPQRLTANLRLQPRAGFDGLLDDLHHAVDYYAVSRAVQELAAARPRKLIETLVTELAGMVLERFSVEVVEIELRKYILSDTEYVAVSLRREA